VMAKLANSIFIIKLASLWRTLIIMRVWRIRRKPDVWRGGELVYERRQNAWQICLLRPGVCDVAWASVPAAMAKSKPPHAQAAACGQARLFWACCSFPTSPRKHRSSKRRKAATGRSARMGKQ